MHTKALNISTDTDLTETGQAKKLAREVSGEVGKFSSRLRQEAKRLDRERKELGEAISAKVAEGASSRKQMRWNGGRRCAGCHASS